MRSLALQPVLASFAFAALKALAGISPGHASPSVESLASSSGLIVLASVPRQADATPTGTVTVEIEEVWKGDASGSLHVTASAPWMSSPWTPQTGERFVLFLQSSAPARPYRLLDLGASHFHVSPFSPPVVDVLPGLLPGTLLVGEYCRRVPLLEADGTITYKKVCKGNFTSPLSVLRKAVKEALARTSREAVLPTS